jgi:hypothetical protein
MFVYKNLDHLKLEHFENLLSKSHFAVCAQFILTNSF